MATNKKRKHAGGPQNLFEHLQSRMHPCQKNPYKSRYIPEFSGSLDPLRPPRSPKAGEEVEALNQRENVHLLRDQV